MPAFTESGRQVEAKMTLDAGSELVIVPFDLQLDDTFDDRAVQTALADLRAHIARVRRSSTVVYATPDAAVSSIDPDEFL